MSVKTSIILCTYNEANHIEKTISELEKNVSNLELVIVDDFSSDGTSEILKRLNQNNRYKVVFRKKSRSLASAFVRGVVETTGAPFFYTDNKFFKPLFSLLDCIALIFLKVPILSSIKHLANNVIILGKNESA